MSTEEAQLTATNEKHKAFFAAVWDHVTSWAEVYWWLPLALLSIIAAAYYARFLTGRPPQENADFLVDYASRLVLCIVLIALLSIKREQTGFWMTKAEAFANPEVYKIQTIAQCFFGALFVYTILH